MNNLQSSTGVNFQVQTQEATSFDLLPALWRRRAIIAAIVGACILGAVLVTLQTRKVWQAEVQLVLIQRPASGKASQDPAYSDPLPETPETQLGMLQSPAMVQKTIEWLQNESVQSQQPLSGELLDPDKLTKAISAVNPKESNVINLDVDEHSRDDAIMAANAAALAFVQWKTELAHKDIQQTAENLQSQILAAQRELDIATRAQLAFRQGHHLTNVPLQENSAIAVLQAAQTNVDSVEQDLASQRSQLTALGSELKFTNKAIDAGDGVRDDALVQSLQTALNQAEMDRADQAQKVTSLYPGILPQADAKIRDLKQRLSRAIGATVGGRMPSLQSEAALIDTYHQAEVTVSFTQARLAAAVRIRNDAEKSVASLPRLETNETRLDRAVTLTTQRLTELQSALDAANLQINSSNSDVQIAESSIAPYLPIRPVLLTNIILGTLSGLFLAVIVALMLEQSDQRIYDLAQISHLTNHKILGLLPELSSKFSLNGNYDGRPTAALADSMSALRANLLRALGPAMAARGFIVLVTSADVGEGKTTVVSELARSLAVAGKKVILVDANLRNPSLRSYYPGEQTAGLADVIARGATLNETVIMDFDPNLMVLHAGTVGGNASDRISSPRMFGILSALRRHSDIVLLDAPACDVIDPLLIAPYADYVLQVISMKTATKPGLIGAAGSLNNVSQVGLVVNRLAGKPVPAYAVANSINKLSQAPEQRRAAGSGDIVASFRLASAEGPLVDRNGTNGLGNHQPEASAVELTEKA